MEKTNHAGPTLTVPVWHVTTHLLEIIQTLAVDLNTRFVYNTATVLIVLSVEVLFYVIVLVKF